MLAAVPRAASTLPSQRSDGCEADEAVVRLQQALEWSYPVAERTCGVHDAMDHDEQQHDVMDHDEQQHDAMDHDEQQQARYLTVTRPSLRPHVTLRDTALHSLRSSTAWHSGAPCVPCTNPARGNGGHREPAPLPRPSLRCSLLCAAVTQYTTPSNRLSRRILQVKLNWLHEPSSEQVKLNWLHEPSSEQ
jgi:hypothetical protein